MALLRCQRGDGTCWLLPAEVLWRPAERGSWALPATSTVLSCWLLSRCPGKVYTSLSAYYLNHQPEKSQSCSFILNVHHRTQSPSPLISSGHTALLDSVAVRNEQRGNHNGRFYSAPVNDEPRMRGKAVFAALSDTGISSHLKNLARRHTHT